MSDTLSALTMLPTVLAAVILCPGTVMGIRWASRGTQR